MSEPTNPDDDRQRRLEEAMAEYLIAADAGRAPEAETFLAGHPDLRTELAGFLADLSALAGLIEPLLPEGDAPSGPVVTSEPRETRPLSSETTWGVPPPHAAETVAQREQARGPGTTVTIDSAAGTGITTDPGATATFGEGPQGTDASVALPGGTRVRYFGDYELLGVLGEGAMGIVYKARQHSLNRSVALKMIKAARFATPDDLRRFQNEAEAVAGLDHPNIVPIFEVGQFENQHYFSMKLISGVSLDKRLKDFSAAPRRAALLVGVVSDATHHAHQRGILHRDLKPANILVDAEGQPHVTDFGLAKRVEGDSELTQTGAILGTPAYMAPEQTSAKKGAVTTASDVYGLGAVLYALLTGHAPFRGDSVADTLQQVRERVPEPPSRLNRRVPRDVEVICLKCLEKDPHRRYASAEALAQDLRRWLAGEPITARPIGSTARLRMWCRRNPAVAGSIGLVAAALMVVAVLALLYADRQTRLATSESLRAEEETRHGGEQAKAAANLKHALAQSNRRLALLNLERGRAACDQGQIGSGLLWMVESLRAATDAGDPDWKNAALANLSDWRRYCIALKGVYSYESNVTILALSPDGQRLAYASGEFNKPGEVKIWDATTGLPIGQSLVHQGTVTAVAFSPDGRRLAYASGELNKPGEVKIWDATTGLPIGQPLVHQGMVTAVAFSPDGQRLAYASGEFNKPGEMKIWDATTGLPVGQPLVHQGMVTAVAFSPDGKTILTGSQDKTARLWDATTGLSIGRPLVHQGMVTAVAFSPDGNTLLTSCGDGTARLWDAATGHPIGKPLNHQGIVTAVAFSPDSKTIVTGSVDGTPNDPHTGSTAGSARLWDAATGLPLAKPLEYQSAVYAVAFSSDGKTILVGSSDGIARLWDAATGLHIGKPLQHEHPEVRSVAFSPNGKTVLTGNFDGRAQFWDVATGLPVGKPLQHQAGITAAIFSPDGKTVLTGSRDRTARLWDAATSLPIGQPLVHQGFVEAVAYSPDGKTVLTGSWDKTARLWNTDTGKPTGPPLRHPAAVDAVTFSPDGKRILTGCQDRTARLWDAATGLPVGQPLVHQGMVTAVAFSPDGKTILTGSQDKTARLWNTDTGKPTGPPLRHPAAVDAVTFSPDGRTILTGSLDKTARLWDAATGQPIGKPLEHADMVYAVAFSPDGKTVLTGSHRGMARLWETPVPLPDNLPRLVAWVETLTGLELDEQGAIRVLDGAAWRQWRDCLSQLGGPPPADTAWSRDPILFGPDPTARARAWTERKRWAEADAAFDEAVRAQPLNRAVQEERCRSYLARPQPGKAAAYCREAVLLEPDNLDIRRYLILTLVTAGDRGGLRREASDLLERFRDMSDRTANAVAWYCTLAPGAVADPEAPVRLAEFALKNTGAQRDSVLNTLGATLYRAGRSGDAIRRLEEGIRLRRGESLPQDWVFLSMAHARLGHHDEARRWLDRFRDYQPNADPNQFWEELEIRLLRGEAEAVVLYDPIFPADPFAH